MMRELIIPFSKLLREGELLSIELTKKYIEAIEMENGAVNAYCHTSFETALQLAEKADEEIRAGRGTLLTGIPMTLKDNICTSGEPTTCCSKILEDYVPFYDATAWSRLKNSGAVLLGKTNMDEFAMGTTTRTSVNGATRNPFNTACSAGGSSGGTAAAVSMGLAAYGIGSDTGGSVRQPAAHCGIVGLKPTYGAVSRYGLIAYASSLDQIGVIARSVKDTAIVFDAVKGRDNMDMTSCDAFGSVADKLEKSDLNGLRIGVDRKQLDLASEDVKAAINKALDFFADNSAELVDINLPSSEELLSAYFVIACAEASSNLGRYDSLRYGWRADGYSDNRNMIVKTRSQGFGDEVKRRIMLGTYVLSTGYSDAYYKKACLLRNRLSQQLENVFKDCDVIISPTVPDTAPLLDKEPNSPTEPYREDIFTVTANLTGVPSVSVPAGCDGKGLPIGMQIIGNKHCEELILRTAYFYEQNSDVCVTLPRGGVVV